MENFSKFSVSNNHLKAFKAGIVEILEYVNNLENEFTQTLDGIKRLSEEKKRLLDSLEAKFNKYNFKYKKPLADNTIEEIKSYVSYLESELVISVVSLSNEKREKVIRDNLDMTSEMAQIERINNYIDINGREIGELEQKLHDIRIPEKDSQEEVIVDFKTLMAKKKAEKKTEEEKDKDSELKIIKISDYLAEKPEEKAEEMEAKEEEMPEAEISPFIFSTESDDSVLTENDIINFFDNKFREDEEEIQETTKAEEDDPVVVDITITNGSLADKVETVYGRPEYWTYIYNYSESNQGTIDRKASEAQMAVEDAVYDDEALEGIIVGFPTILDIYDIGEDEEYLAPIYDEEERRSRAA